MFTRMIGTLAVILLVSAFIGSSETISGWVETGQRWKYMIFAAVLGGAFGIYGNISGFELNGAVVSVRDIGPMLAGFLGGPFAGLAAGLAAGVHRLTMGGITAQACVVATCSIGLICGLVSGRKKDHIVRPVPAMLFSAAMEAWHLTLVLLIVRPFETAFDIVRQIAVPFIIVNALGFMLIVTISAYTKKQRSLVMERSKLQSELEVANVIQHSLLPVISDTYPGRKEVDVSAYMKAAKEVGGDFYDVFYVDSNRLAFVIGDVSGKGIPAALFMAFAKITLQNCIRDIPKLSEAVQEANNILCARNEAEMFVTLWVGILDLSDYMMTYVCAGHNPPVLVRDGSAEYLKARSGFVLAGMEDMFYRENVLKMAGGDMLYLYTDGVTEAENVQHELFGEDRLIISLQHSKGSDAFHTIEEVRSSVHQFVNGHSQFDDITMLCFRIRE